MGTKYTHTQSVCVNFLGLADEVGEIIIELQENITAANRLLKKAVEAKLAFCADDLMKFLYANDKALAAAAVYYSASILTVEDIETLYGEVDDEVIIKICAKQHLALPEEMRDENEEWESDENDEPLAENMDVPINNQKNFGFFGFLFAILGIAKGVDRLFGRPQKHNGKCNGDCAHCPPHYGYRHGR